MLSSSSSSVQYTCVSSHIHHRKLWGFSNQPSCEFDRALSIIDRNISNTELLAVRAPLLLLLRPLRPPPPPRRGPADRTRAVYDVGSFHHIIQIIKQSSQKKTRTRQKPTMYADLISSLSPPFESLSMHVAMWTLRKYLHTSTYLPSNETAHNHNTCQNWLESQKYW